MASPLKVGFGLSCITPPLPCRLAGYARREGLSRRVAQQLWARSVVLDNGDRRIGWVVCDLLEVSRSLTADIRAAVEARGSLSGHDVLVGATHTHAGPDLYRDWEADEGRYTDGRANYLSFLPHAVASSMVSAVADLSPSSLSWAEDSIHGIGADRRAGTVRPQPLGVLKATAEGRLKGMVLVYPCHGTVLGPDNLEVSGDIIGACVEALETTTGATGRCAWAQGAAGDISTRGTRRERSPREARRMGSLVAAAAVRAAARAVPLADELSLDRVVVPLPHKSADQYRADAASPQPRDESDRSEAALLEEAMVARRARQGRGRPAEDEAEVSWLRIGELNLCFVPGEPFESIERALAERTGLPGARVVGYCNGAPGYIFGLEDELHGGYEVLSSPLTGEAGPRIVDRAATLASSHR